jgi:hypothetical protein
MTSLHYSKSNISTLLFQIASKSPQDRKYGCIIIHRNKVVGEGHNYHDGFNSKSCLL